MVYFWLKINQWLFDTNINHNGSKLICLVFRNRFSERERGGGKKEKEKGIGTSGGGKNEISLK